MRTEFKWAIVKFNGGRGALLCNECRVIIRENFNLDDIEDKKYYCPLHRNTWRRVNVDI